MKLGLLFLAATTSLGCLPLGEATGETTTVCTIRNAHGLCTQYEPRETDVARWLRVSSEEPAREEAYRKGEPFFPAAIPGESSDDYGRRMDEERRRLDAYRRGDVFFPDHRAGESPQRYLERAEEDRRRGEAYRKGQTFSPAIGPGR